MTEDNFHSILSNNFTYSREDFEYLVDNNYVKFLMKARDQYVYRVHKEFMLHGHLCEKFEHMYTSYDI